MLVSAVPKRSDAPPPPPPLVENRDKEHSSIYLSVGFAFKLTSFGYFNFDRNFYFEAVTYLTILRS